MKVKNPLIALAVQYRSRGDDDLVVAIAREAEERGWRLLDLEMTGGTLGRDQPDGLLTTYLPDSPPVQALIAEHVSAVRIGLLPHPQDEAVPVIYPNHHHAGRLAAKHLIERGFRHLASIGHEQMQVLRLLSEGFHEAATEAGCSVHQHLIASYTGPSDPAVAIPFRQRRMAKVVDWLKSLPKPVGIMARNAMASKVAVLCDRENILIPEEVAIVATHFRWILLDASSVPLTTVDVDWADMGQRAVAHLDDLMQGRKVPSRTEVASEPVVTRRSSDILAVDDALVARTVRYLWDHFDEDLSVDQVAATMDVPRTNLERLFRRHLKRGVHEELRRYRLQRFCDLLKTTDIPVEQLVPKVGFGSASYLGSVFRKTFGVTPRKYRLQAQAGKPVGV